MNSFDDIIRPFVETGEGRLPLTITMERFFTISASGVFQRLKPDFCRERAADIFKFFGAGFRLTEVLFNKFGQLEDAVAIEDMIGDSFCQFAIKLTEDDLRKLVMKLVKFAAK